MIWIITFVTTITSILTITIIGKTNSLLSGYLAIVLFSCNFNAGDTQMSQETGFTAGCVQFSKTLKQVEDYLLMIFTTYINKFKSNMRKFTRLGIAFRFTWRLLYLYAVCAFCCSIGKTSWNIFLQLPFHFGVLFLLIFMLIFQIVLEDR